jgi:hypothetical protein
MKSQVKLTGTDKKSPFRKGHDCKGTSTLLCYTIDIDKMKVYFPEEDNNKERFRKVMEWVETNARKHI